ncbi:hypothetical protein XACM_1385 [Xanthomonas euvesicatoria pv. citrumelo F1]|nr:hypothetical protein XACM_1385 [Xanthomonas euvesicatoria pv. citrumelo F1]
MNVPVVTGGIEESGLEIRESKNKGVVASLCE